MKRLLPSLFLSLFTLFGIAQETISVRFEWANDSLGGVFFEKTSMHIPVQFYEDSSTYYFQFDTGSNRSFLYTDHGISEELTKSLTSASGHKASIGEIQLLKTNSNQAYTKNGKRYIGTIGADLFKDKVVEIDFVNQFLTIHSSYDSTQFHWIAMKTNRGRPVLQFVIEGAEYDFLFDTGSSLFELWTTKKLWKKWMDVESDIKEFPISSWGEINTASRAKLKAHTAYSLCPEIQLEAVWFNSSKKFAKNFKRMGVSGIIGNKPFLKHSVLLDLKNKKMGLKNCEQ